MVCIEKANEMIDILQKQLLSSEKAKERVSKMFDQSFKKKRKKKDAVDQTLDTSEHGSLQSNHGRFKTEMQEFHDQLMKDIKKRKKTSEELNQFDVLLVFMNELIPPHIRGCGNVYKIINDGFARVRDRLMHVVNKNRRVDAGSGALNLLSLLLLANSNDGDERAIIALVELQLVSGMK